MGGVRLTEAEAQKMGIIPGPLSTQARPQTTPDPPRPKLKLESLDHLRARYPEPSAAPTPSTPSVEPAPKVDRMEREVIFSPNFLASYTNSGKSYMDGAYIMFAFVMGMIVAQVLHSC